jgi:hypothetical protein
MKTKDEQYWMERAKENGVAFEGFQSFLDWKRLPMFTHPLYGTFVVSTYETLPAAILRKKNNSRPTRRARRKHALEYLCN